MSYRFSAKMAIVKCLLGILTICVCLVSASYDISDKIVFPNLPNAAPRSENTICRSESQVYIENLNNMTLWAHKMWDSTAKSTVGVLKGSNFHFGNFDECLSITAPFRTQYCFVTLDAKIPDEYNRTDPFQLTLKPMDHVLKRLYRTKDISQQVRNSIKVGWCVPASCTAVDLERSLNLYLAKHEHPFNKFNVSYSAEVNEQLCQRENEIYVIDTVDISFCILVGILVLLVIVGSIYEVRSSQDENKSNSSLIANIICSFSVRKSYQEIQKADEGNAALKVLYGIRTFAIMMIVTDHRFGTFISGPMDNYDYIEKEYRSLSSWFLFHGDLFVDTFFILSGILVTYGLLNQYNKKFVHPAFIILLRYVRLTPVYAIVLFFWSTMLKHIGYGPFWNIVIPKEVTDCRKYWWANLLYISNYVGESDMCMVHSWYLPCDFHYFILAIFIVRLLHQNTKKGLILMTFLYIVSVLVPLVITILYLRPGLLHFYPVFLVNPKGSADFQLTYTKTHTRASTYILGMFAGYIFYKLKDKECRMSKIKSHLLTLVSIIFLFFGMASGAIFYNPYHEYNVIEAALYAGFHRSLWALGTIGLIFSASYGHATVLYNSLTWSPCITLGKLVYGVYLVHMLFQLRGVAMATNPRHFNYFNTFSYAISDIVWAFFISFLIFIAIENPFRKIIKLLLFPQQKDKTQTTKDTIDIPTRYGNVSTSRL